MDAPYFLCCQCEPLNVPVSPPFCFSFFLDDLRYCSSSFHGVQALVTVEIVGVMI